MNFNKSTIVLTDSKTTKMSLLFRQVKSKPNDGTMSALTVKIPKRRRRSGLIPPKECRVKVDLIDGLPEVCVGEM